MVATAEAACMPTPEGVPVDASPVGADEAADSCPHPGDRVSVDEKDNKTRITSVRHNPVRRLCRGKLMMTRTIGPSLIRCRFYNNDARKMEVGQFFLSARFVPFKAL
jgi:hypothetical protein